MDFENSRRHTNTIHFSPYWEIALASLESLSKILQRGNLKFVSLSIKTEKIILLFVVQAPTLELKLLPSHLKDIYLGDNDTLSFIICSHFYHETIGQDFECL